MQETITYLTPLETGKTFKRNGRTRLLGLTILRGKYKGCKIIDDDLRFHGTPYVVIELNKKITAKILFSEALTLV